MAPRDQTSAAGVAIWPEATSGARYAGEPVTRPVCVREASASARAMPKSDSFTWPSAVTRMLEGFTSRCTMPDSCAAASASAACRSSGAASSGERAPSCRTSSARRAPLDVLHDQPVVVALHHQVEDRDHVRVVEPGGEPGLALGPLEIRAADTGETETLERHLAAEHAVGAQPDGTHAATPDLAVERVPASDLHRLPSRTACQPTDSGWALGSPIRQAGGVQHHLSDPARRAPRDHRPEPPRRPGVARPARAVHGSRRPARSAERRERPVLCGLRPDRAEPPHGQPRPDPHRAPAPGGRPHAVRPGRRRDRHDRGPQGLRRAHPQLPRHRQGVGGARAQPDRAVPVVRRPERRHDGRQLRLDREPVDDRLPARHRQALPGQPDAGARDRASPARVGDQLHGVQLRAAAVDGLPQPLPRPRRHAAARRVPTSGATSPAASSWSGVRPAARPTRSRPRWSPRPTAPSTGRRRAARSGSTRR